MGAVEGGFVIVPMWNEKEEPADTIVPVPVKVRVAVTVYTAVVHETVLTEVLPEEQPTVDGTVI